MNQYYLEPGLYTDMINPFEENALNWPFLHDCGFTWATFLSYNPSLWNGTKSYDLAAVKAHGFTNIGYWGVLYAESDFYNGGKQMGAQAKKDGADHLIIDCEQVYKDSKPLSKGKEIIKGIRDGGWTKGVSLSTLGSPVNPTVNDFAMDTDSFLSSGNDASVQPQDYFNDYEEYTPKNSEIYWPRVNVPSTRMNHTIGLYNGRRGKVTGDQWVALLKAAKVGRNFSVYMAQNASKADYGALSNYIKSIAVPSSPTAPQTPTYDSAKAKADMLFAAQKWLNGQAALSPPNRQVFSRIRQARRILLTTDKQWADNSGKVKQLLDDIGVQQ